jgi:hypothetical protein
MKYFLLSITTLALSACATITASAEQEITITTNPAGANCLISNTQQEWQVESTPGTVTVTRGFEPLGVSCTLAGYEVAHTLIESKTRGRSYGNILLGGIPAYVDAGTGKGYEYEPSDVTLTLTPASTVTN